LSGCLGVGGLVLQRRVEAKTGDWAKSGIKRRAREGDQENLFSLGPWESQSQSEQVGGGKTNGSDEKFPPPGGESYKEVKNNVLTMEPMKKEEKSFELSNPAQERGEDWKRRRIVRAWRVAEIFVSLYQVGCLRKMPCQGGEKRGTL